MMPGSRGLCKNERGGDKRIWRRHQRGGGSRRRGGLLANEEDGEVEERLGRGEQEELLRRMAEVENLAQDPNHPVLLDPAAVARAPTARVEDFNAQGPARSSRQRHKCPVEGCPITRNSQEALNVHIDNSHD